MSTITLDKKSTSHTPLFEPKDTSLYHPRVSYHSNPDVAQYHYGPRHPMKPFRLMLTDHLVAGYKLHTIMDLYRPRRADRGEILEFHAEEYIEFLQKVTPETASKFSKFFSKFNIGDDCPVFDGLYDYCTIYAGCSLDASRKLIAGMTDIACSWSGGLHHAKKFEPSGFCYVNDIVLAILNLLRYYPRVLYVDIDLHHGDGVQEAFYTTDRVLTCSFHKYNGEFFPGTGNVDETGAGRGKHYAVNVPLRDGIDDETYVKLFKSVMEPVVTGFQPSVIVQQCGADSLGGDRLGCFNLNIRAHGECVNFMKSFGVPMIVMGGGGYTPRNVSRLWCYETAVCLDVHLASKLPMELPFRDYFGPDYSLHPNLGDRIENKNSRKFLETVTTQVLEQVRYLNGAPSVALQEVPPELCVLAEEEEELEALNEEMERKEREEKEEKDGARVREMME